MSNDIDLEYKHLKRNPIDSHLQRQKNRKNPTEKRTIYPTIDKQEVNDMEEDTHSVHDDPKGSSGEDEQQLINSPNSKEDMTRSLPYRREGSPAFVTSEDTENLCQRMLLMNSPNSKEDVTRRIPYQREGSKAFAKSGHTEKSMRQRMSLTNSPDSKEDRTRRSPYQRERSPALVTSGDTENRLGSKLNRIYNGLEEMEKTFALKYTRFQRSTDSKNKPNRQKEKVKNFMSKSAQFQESTDTSRSSLIWIFLLLPIVLILGYNFFPLFPSKKSSWNYESVVSSFKPSFEGQPKYSFKVVNSALNSINKRDPSAPAVILLLASKGAEELAGSLGERIVDSVSPTPIKIHGKKYKNLDSDSGKKLIDDALRSINFTSESKYEAVLVEDLHLIPGETALMFHTYCDNENAPYKHAVYVLILHTGETIPVSSKMKDWDEAAYKRLNKAWADIDEDQRSPLLSRLTVSVAAIVNTNINK